MQNLTFLILLNSIITLSFGQSDNYPIKWNETEKIDYNDNWYMGTDSQYIYYGEYSKGKGLVKAYDFDLNLKSSKSTYFKNLPEGKDKINKEELINLKGNTYSISGFLDKKAGDYTIYSRTLNNKGLGEYNILYDLDFDVEKEISELSHITLTSENKEYLLLYIHYETYLIKKYGYETRVVLFDSNLKKVLDKVVNSVTDFETTYVDISEIDISNNGSVIMLYTERSKTKKTKSHVISNQFFKIMSVNNENQIDLPSTNGFYFEHNNFSKVINNKIKHFSYYSNDFDGKYIDGILIKDVNINTNKVDTFKYQFERNEILKIDDKGKGIPSSFNVSNIKELENGGYILIGQYTDSRLSYEEYYLYSNDLIISFFTEEGKLIKNQVINKNFISPSYTHVGYNSTIYNNKLYLIFNNYKLEGSNKKMNTGKIFTELVVLDLQGNIEYREVLFEKDQLEPIYENYNSEFIDNYFIFRLSNRKAVKAGIMKLD